MKENLETYELVGWENGQITKEAVITIDGIEYEVTPRIISGKTPLNATNLSKMDTAIQKNRNAINDLYNNQNSWIVDTLEGNETNKTPSVNTVNDALNGITDIQTITPTLSNVTGTISCYVKNGICYFSMKLKSTSETLDAYAIIATGLPKSLSEICFNATNGDGSGIRLQLTKNGELSIANQMTNVSNYLGTVSYVVDESQTTST